MDYLFKDIVIGEEGLLKGPFGSDLKKTLYVEKGDDTYKVYIQENILKENNHVGNYFISNEYYNSKMSRYAVKENDFIVTCDGTLGEIFQLKNIKEKGIISSSLLRITINPSLCDYDYFYYYFKSFIKKGLIVQGNNSVLKHLPGIGVIKKFKISLPDLKIQREIGQFLKTIDRKIRINNRINDNLQQLAEKIYDYYFMKPLNDEKCSSSYYKKQCNALLEVKTGKQDANFGTENGNYKFFTCSKDTLKCDIPAFSGHSILIAGNGDFNVKHYTGKFNAYQRTYVLIPDNDLYYGAIYMASVKLVNKFKKASSGSIVKFISKSDVENIEVIIPKDHTLLEKLNKYLFAIEKHQEEIETLEKLRNFLLPMLMNGQVSIA